MLHNLEYAEAKGTGIRTMREEMLSAKLSVPLIETSTLEGEGFILTLLSHQLFNQESINWLAGFKSYKLSQAEERGLIVLRETGRISNSTYRAINEVATLTASAHLKRLKELGIIRRNDSYYTFADKSLIAVPNKIQHLSDEATPETSEKQFKLSNLSSYSLSKKIKNIGQNPQ